VARQSTLPAEPGESGVSWARRPEQIQRWTALFAVAICMWCGMWGGWEAIAVAEQRAVTDIRQDFALDIPAQPLDSALLAFSTLTGFELVYDSGLIGQATSVAVRGQLTAEDAVVLILQGSGLHARKVAARTITISRNSDTKRDSLQPSPERDRHAIYFAAIQDSLNAAFCDGGITRVAGQRMMLRFRVGAAGDITQLELMDLSRGGGPNPKIASALSRIKLKQPPPDLPQPVMVLISPAAGVEDLPCAAPH
jgi:hypothetical protein